MNDNLIENLQLAIYNNDFETIKELYSKIDCNKKYSCLGVS